VKAGLVMDASAAAGRVGERGCLVGSPFTFKLDRGKLWILVGDG
jgi:hypothetical protein